MDSGGGAWHFWAIDWARHRRIRAALASVPADLSASFGIELSVHHANFMRAIVFLPRERELSEFLIAQIKARMQAGGEAWLVGPIRAGVRSLVPAIERGLGRIARSYSGRHSRLYLAEKMVLPAGEKALSDWVEWHEVETAGHRLMIAALPGVFSQGRLDPGTRLLLETLREPQSGRVLDFGCGCGVIGAALMKGWPAAAVELADSGAAAVASANLTLAANDLKGGRVRATDVFSELPDRYDFIITNPPYHSGIETDWAVAEALARQAPEHLRRGGRLRLVTNQYPRWRRIAPRILGEPKILARAGSFHVLEATVTRARSGRNIGGVL